MHISLQPNVVDLRYYKLLILLSVILSLKYQKFTPSGSKVIEIGKFEFLAKNQFLIKIKCQNSLQISNCPDLIMNRSNFLEFLMIAWRICMPILYISLKNHTIAKIGIELKQFCVKESNVGFSNIIFYYC